MRRVRAEWIAFHLDALADQLLEALRDGFVGRIDVDGVGALDLSISSPPLRQAGVDGHLPILIRLQALARCGRGVDQCRERESSKPQSHVSLPASIIARNGAAGSPEAA